ncbi:hypothetical protein [Edaphobacter bradus]|uniref:hypothetical protein n=1 Tax=Edaphobacter bradus TaxID=2259016 RepID=UPI0021DF496C|nr:hypothetical protein [Edaphobacter bradus]
MGAFWRAKTALTSAAKGWACVWLLLLVSQTIGLLRAKPHVPLADLASFASIALIWIVSTGVVTLGATILFIVPYVCLMSVDKLLATPWRMYLEPVVIVIFVSLGLNYFTKPYAHTFLQSLPPYLMFALFTSLASSAFFMQRLKASTRQGASPSQL